MPSYDGDDAPEHALAYLIEAEIPADRFEADVLEGLAAPQPYIPPKYFYDARGAELFQRICDTPEYYPTRAEAALLANAAGEIAALAGPNANLYEPGSGAAEKARILLSAMDAPAEYTLFDIADDQLRTVALDLNQRFPDLRVGAIHGDFTQPFSPTADMFHGEGRRICFFPGSTLGNFDPEAAVQLLLRFRAVLRPGDALLLGVDLSKDAAILDAAYNDAAGWTAEFNLNLLRRLQTELGATLSPADFKHVAFYEPATARIEMHLAARRETTIRLNDTAFHFAAGATIHTENSWKFTTAKLNEIAEKAGFRLTRHWRGEQADFLIGWCEVA